MTVNMQELTKLERVTVRDGTSKSSERRRTQHTKAQENYNEAVTLSSKDLEHLIIDECNKLKSKLQSLDEKLVSGFLAFEDTSFLSSAKYEDILNAWEEWEATCQKRENEIEEFSTILERTEHRRSRLLSKEIQTYTEILLDTEYILPPVTERIVEKESHKLNVVVLSNLHQYTGLINKLLVTNVDFLQNARKHWEDGRQRWRQGHHNKQIDELKASLMSLNFVFTREMEQTFGLWRADLERIHNDNRLRVLSDMQNDGANLTVEKIRAIRAQVASCDADENEITTRCFNTIRSIQDQQKRALSKHCENTRQALHEFTGLFHSTELLQCKQKLEMYLQDTLLAEFFLMADGLKIALDFVSNSLRSPQLIPHPEFTCLVDVLDVITNASTRLILEQDHDNLSQSIKSSLEKLRGNDKSDLMENLLVLQTFLTSLQKLPDLHGTVIKELSQIQNDLNDLLDSNKLAETENSLVTDSSKGVIANEVAMGLNSISDIRRRLTILVHSSGLQDDFCKLLIHIRHQLLHHRRAGATLNEAIQPYENSMLLSIEELNRAIQTFILAAENQKIRMQAKLERYLCFIGNIVDCKEAMQEDIEWINTSASTLLHTILDSSARDLQVLESDLDKSSQLLRRAPDPYILEIKSRAITDMYLQLKNEYVLYDSRIKCATPLQYRASRLILHRYLLCLVKHFRLVGKPEYDIENIESSASRSSLEKIFTPSGIEDIRSQISNSTKEADASKENAHESDLINSYSQDDEEKTNWNQFLEQIRSFENLDREHGMSDLLQVILLEHDTDQAPPEVVEKSDENAAGVGKVPAKFGSEIIHDGTKDIEVSVKLDLELNFPERSLSDTVFLTMLQKYREDLFVQLDAFSNRTFQSIRLLGMERAAEGQQLLDVRLSIHCIQKSTGDAEFYQTRKTELAKHKNQLERLHSRISKKLQLLQERFSTSSSGIQCQFEKHRILQLSLQTCLPLQTKLASLRSIQIKYKKNAAVFKIDSRKSLDNFKLRNEEEIMGMDSMLKNYINDCRKRVFQDNTTEDIASHRDYHKNEVDTIEVELAAFAQKVDNEFHHQRLLLLDTMEQTREELLGKEGKFEERYRQAYHDLELKEGLGPKFGHPKRKAQMKFWSEVHRTDRDFDDIDHLLQDTSKKLHLYFVSKEMETEALAFVADTFRSICTLRSKFYHRGVFFQFLKFKMQLKPTPVSLLLLYPNESSNAQVEVYNTVKFADEACQKQDDECMYPPNSTFALVFEEIKSKLVEETQKMLHDESGSTNLSEYPDGCPTSLNKYLRETQQKFQAVLRDRKAQYQEQINEFRNILELAIGAIFQIVLAESCARITNEEKAYSQQFQSVRMDDSQKTGQTMEYVETTHGFYASGVQALYKAALVFEHNVSAVSEAFLSLLDSCVLDEHDLIPMQDDPQSERKRKSLRKLQKLVNKAECGDKREVPHSAQDLDLWKKAGESARYPKRANPPIQEATPRQSLDKHIPPEELGGILEGIDEEFYKFTGTKDLRARACVILSTSIHRKVIKCRDECHSSFKPYASAAAERLVIKFISDSDRTASTLSTEYP
uniref:Uncharacterized protein AlNc14C59G4363 n=1 Tax=Albugo laibachii Nc14 TaxID=890382 RepID=F0WCI3_9STRA|nr:conserved hypothetical protein [Albugo laibachii Nc14]|eukprot:CCA18900.1 conserved hypothetical protein [Albugo laibachii Nc14]